MGGLDLFQAGLPQLWDVPPGQLPSSQESADSLPKSWTASLHPG